MPRKNYATVLKYSSSKNYIIIFFQTERLSTIPVRLVSTYPGLNFFGRVEVFHNNQWGTICDDSFGRTEAYVVCQMLNFTGGALCYSGGHTFGQGTGALCYII